MRIDSVRVYPVLLPFSAEFSHSLRKRFSAKNVIVEVAAEKGALKGYGEGAPRSYVTGESQKSAAKSIDALVRQAHFPWILEDVSQIWGFVDGLPEEKQHNAAVCALESALLDLMGKHQRKNVIEYFPHDHRTAAAVYHATFPLTNKRRILEICRLCREMKINRLRIKVGRDFKQNRDTLEAIRSVFADDCELRMDINGSWNREIAERHIPLLAQYGVRILEQPLMPEDPYIAEFAARLAGLGILMMADESACTLSDVKRIDADGYFRMINVRLSKCGGFRSSLKIIDYARHRKIGFQIGCHLGESGILSAAGRVLCLLCRDAAYCDGSYDRFLLQENLTTQDVCFGVGGKASPLTGFGLGVEVDPDRLARFSGHSRLSDVSRP